MHWPGQKPSATRAAEALHSNRPSALLRGHLLQRSDSERGSTSLPFIRQHCCHGRLQVSCRDRQRRRRSSVDDEPLQQQRGRARVPRSLKRGTPRPAASLWLNCFNCCFNGCPPGSARFAEPHRFCFERHPRASFRFAATSAALHWRCLNAQVGPGLCLGGERCMRAALGASMEMAADGRNRYLQEAPAARRQQPIRARQGCVARGHWPKIGFRFGRGEEPAVYKRPAAAAVHARRRAAQSQPQLARPRPRLRRHLRAHRRQHPAAARQKPLPIFPPIQQTPIQQEASLLPLRRTRQDAARR